MCRRQFRDKCPHCDVLSPIFNLSCKSTLKVERMKLSLMAFMALLALTSADIYDNCGANGDNCFAIPLFESDVKTCIAQRDCTVVTSFNREASGMIKFQIEAEYNGVDDGSHWVGLGFSADGGRSMGEDAVIACYGSTVANYWNTIPFWSVPLEVSILVSGTIDILITQPLFFDRMRKMA